MFSWIFENCVNFFQFFFSWSDWFLFVSEKSHRYKSLFLFEIVNSRLTMFFKFNFSIIIERCQCVNWIVITQLHFSNWRFFRFNLWQNYDATIKNFLKRYRDLSLIWYQKLIFFRACSSSILWISFFLQHVYFRLIVNFHLISSNLK